MDGLASGGEEREPEDEGERPLDHGQEHAHQAEEHEKPARAEHRHPEPERHRGWLELSAPVARDPESLHFEGANSAASVHSDNGNMNRRHHPDGWLTIRTRSVQNFGVLETRSQQLSGRAREEERLLGFLRSRGLRVTSERLLLLREVFAQQGHIDAEQVLEAVRRRGHAISRATVYRNLELLVEAGLVYRVRLASGKAVYEHLHGGERHHHLICKRCGRVVEFSSPATAMLLEEIARAHGFLPGREQIQILSECRDCQKPQLPKATVDV